MSIPRAIDNNEPRGDSGADALDAHAAPDWLLVGKLAPPEQRITVASREALLKRLDESLSRSLSVIVSPPGFGKTTLLTSWLFAGGAQPRAAWLSLDEEDNDPVRFFYYVVAALQAFEPGIGRAPISLFGFLQRPAARDLMTLLLNEIDETTEPVLLVLDDYHLIGNPEIDSALAFLVDRAPERLRLFVATREEPRLPLARWRSLQRITEINLETLRQSWLAVSPMAYFDRFSRWPRKSLIIYAKYDLTFLPELSLDVVAEFERRGLDHKVVVLPCGHYTMGEAPYNYMDGWQLASFLRTAF